MKRFLVLPLLPLVASCAGTSPVPIAPGTFFVSVPVTAERGVEAARILATANAHRHCDREDRVTEILDVQHTPGDAGMPEAIDLVFRCGGAFED